MIWRASAAFGVRQLAAAFSFRLCTNGSLLPLWIPAIPPSCGPCQPEVHHRRLGPLICFHYAASKLACLQSGIKLPHSKRTTNRLTVWPACPQALSSLWQHSSARKSMYSILKICFDKILAVSLETCQEFCVKDCVGGHANVKTETIAESDLIARWSDAFTSGTPLHLAMNQLEGALRRHLQIKGFSV